MLLLSSQFFEASYFRDKSNMEGPGQNPTARPSEKVSGLKVSGGPSCETLGKSLHLSGTQFPHLFKQANKQKLKVLGRWAVILRFLS